MIEQTDHSYIYSLKVLEEARNAPGVTVVQYEELRDLARALGLTDDGDPGDLPAAEEVLGDPIPSLVIVDDEPSLSEVLRMRLVEWGYPPEYINEFALSSDALHHASSSPIDIAFVDIKLDGGAIQDPVYTSGMEVLKAIKDNSPDARVVLVSGFGTYEMARRAILDLGASFYLSKPFRLADALRIVSWAAPKCGTRTPADDSPARPADGEHILIVDNDPVLSESVALGLESYGYRATRVPSGEAACDAVRATRFDAVLLDLMMPGVSGIDVMKWLQKERRHVDVFILSAVSDEFTARQTTELGARGYFLKPCDMGLIIRTLEFHFAKRLGAA